MLNDLGAILGICSMVGLFLYFILRLYVNAEVQKLDIEVNKTINEIKISVAQQAVSIQEDKEFKKEMREVLREVQKDVHSLSKSLVKLHTLNDNEETE
jgi:hypothetical protein